MADLEHATENDNDLHGDPDASHWAERFASKFAVVRRGPKVRITALDYPTDTEGLVLAWFAGAIETGRMVAYADADEKARDLLLDQHVQTEKTDR